MMLLTALQTVILGAHCFLIFYAVLLLLLLYVGISFKQACIRASYFTTYFFIFMQYFSIQKGTVADLLYTGQEHAILLFAMFSSIVVLYTVLRYFYGSAAKLWRFQLSSSLAFVAFCISYA